jgi:DNA-binding IclR family transcriptional regulator
MDIVSGVGVLDKAMSVLRALGDHPLALPELTAATGLPRATAHRLTAALEVHGMVRRDRAGRYELGDQLVTLGRAAGVQRPLADRARPVLAALARETGESVQLFVREGDRRRCLVAVESSHGLRWIVPEGALLPLDVGSSGRLLGGDHEPGRRGWLASVGEREPGVASVSAPVLDGDGRIAGAVSVSGPVERLGSAPGERFGEAVVAAARRLSS